MQNSSSPQSQPEQSQKQSPNLNSTENTELKQLTLRIYDLHYRQIKFKQFDFVAGQLTPDILNVAQGQQLGQFLFQVDECLVLTEKIYSQLYYYLLKIVANAKEAWQFRNKAGDILISMNGENDKVYNPRKAALNSMNSSTQQSESNQQIKLDINRELNLNAAVAMRFKKSSSCYQYRIRLIEHKVKVEKINQDLPSLYKLHKSEHELIVKVLNRFHRNYFCWVYRLRLLKLFISLTKARELFDSEVNMILDMLEKSPNNYSTLSYLRFILRETSKLQFNNEIVNKVINKCEQLLSFCKIAYDTEQQYKRLIDFSIEIKSAQNPPTQTS